MEKSEKHAALMGKRERFITFERQTIDEASRTVMIAVSSEEPYQRSFGIEILDHAPESIDLSFFASGRAPLLADHEPEKLIGIIEEVTLADRRLRAKVRFGKGALATEFFNDVVDGIRTNISVGYYVNDMVLESSTDGLDTYRVTSWQPVEASFVSIPADPTVGVGRSQEKQDEKTTQEIAADVPAQPKKEENMTEENKQPAVNAEAVKAAHAKEIGEILELGAKHNKRELAEKAIKEGKSVAEFRGILLDQIGSAPVLDAGIGMTEKEVKRFSFVKALNALANPSDRKAYDAAAFEREVSVAAADKSGKAATGFLVPFDVLSHSVRNMEKRDMTVGTAGNGGYTVATNLMSDSFIELLRNRMVTQRLGATVLNGLMGNVAFPRHTAGSTAYWVAESGAVTESTPTFDQVTMSPKTCGALTDISRKLLVQSSLDVEGFIRGEIAKDIGLELDRVALYGSGSSNQPYGIKNTSGINTVNFSAAAPTYAEIVDMETQVAADNADIGTLAYLMNARGRGALKTTLVTATYGDRHIWEAGNTVNGYRAEVSNQVEGSAGSTEDYFFGNWADLLMGFWSGLDLTVDPYTGSSSGTVRVVALQDVDIAVRHPVSFCRGANTL